MLIEFCEGGALDDVILDLEKPLTEPQIRVMLFSYLSVCVHNDYWQCLFKDDL